MISVVVPVYKNIEQLIQNLRVNLSFLDQCEVILVNDNPSTSIKKDFEEFPKIKLIENKKNLGFGQTVNVGVQHATNNYVVFLNTDVLLKDNSLLFATKHFEKDSSLFAVGFAQEEKDGTVVGKNMWYWQKGFFYHKKAEDLLLGSTAWAEGGTCIVDKEKFIKIGQFDSIYTPFYWEDIDLSYRAWKAGYKVIFDPSILVEHHHGGTTGKYFKDGFTQKISYRNQFIFIWKNITDASLLLEHLLLLLPNLFYYVVIKRQRVFISSFIAALSKALVIFSRRKKQELTYTKSDKEVIK